ncbi:MAG: efflux transporter outer membrane subunit, partial [Chitinophagaceae bacterium]|nr:efflux transporter outer membrane subunit [Rubrivivax sp.]
RVRQADANLRITAQVAGGQQRSQTPLSTATAASTAGRGGGPRFIQREIFQANLQASYEIDFWGRNRAATEAARQNADAFRFDVGTVRITTEATVANTYFAILAAREQLEIQQQNLAAAERILALLNQRLEVGTGTGLDIAQQQTLVQQQRAQIPPLRQSIDQNIYSLGTLTGQVPESVARPTMPLAQLRLPVVTPGLPAEIIVRRPDVWQAEASLASAQASIESARAALLPAVTLTTSGGFQNLVLENLLRPGSSLYSLAAGISQPIFQLGALRARVRLTEAQADELMENYRAAIVQALVEVEQAIVALRDTTEQETLQAAATRSAERAYAISETQLRAGTIDLITLLNTQLTLFNTRNILVQVRLAKYQAAVGLFRALGGGWG